MNADVLDRFAKPWRAPYQRGGQASTEAILALLTDGTDHWYSAEEAVAAGFADRTVSAIPMAASCRQHNARFTPPAPPGCDSPRPPLNLLRKEMS